MVPPAAAVVGVAAERVPTACDEEEEGSAVFPPPPPMEDTTFCCCCWIWVVMAEIFAWRVTSDWTWDNWASDASPMDTGRATVAVGGSFTWGEAEGRYEGDRPNPR